MDSILESYDFETDSNIETTTNYEYIDILLPRGMLA